VEEYAYCVNKRRQNVGFGNFNMTSNCDVKNSAHQIQITTICHWMEPPPWKFSAYATGTHHLNLCNKEIPANTQHNQHWWPSRTSELCCAWRTSSIVTTPDHKRVFEAYARIFVYAGAVTPITYFDKFGVKINWACIE